MFEALVLFLQASILFSLYFAVPTLFIIRLLIAIKNNKGVLNIIKITLIPFSIGYFLYLEKEKQPKFYNILIVIFTTTTLLGILFTLFQIFIPGL